MVSSSIQLLFSQLHMPDALPPRSDADLPAIPRPSGHTLEGYRKVSSPSSLYRLPLVHLSSCQAYHDTVRLLEDTRDELSDARAVIADLEELAQQSQEPQQTQSKVPSKVPSALEGVPLIISAGAKKFATLSHLWVIPGALKFASRPPINLSTFDRYESKASQEEAMAAEIYDLFPEAEVRVTIGSDLFIRTVSPLASPINVY